MTIEKLLYGVTEYDEYIHVSPHNTEKGLEFIEDLKSDEDNIVTLDVDSDVDGVVSTMLMHKLLKDLGIININIHIPPVKRHGIDQGLINKVIDTKSTHLVITDSSTNSMAELNTLASMGVKILIIDHHLAEYKLKDYPTQVTLISNKLIVTELYNLSAGYLTYLFTEDVRVANGLKTHEEDRIWGYVTLISDSCKLDCPYIRPIILDIKDYYSHIPKQLRMFMTKYDELNRGFVSYKFANKINTLCRNSEIELLDKMFFKFDQLGYEGQQELVKEILDVHSTIGNNTAQFIKTISRNVEDLGSYVYIDLGRYLSLTKLTKQYLINATGVIANRISQEHNKPCVVLIPIDSRTYKGSARDTTGLFDVHTAFYNLITTGGGHRGSIGFTLDKENLIIFKVLLRTLLPVEVKDIRIDCDGLQYDELRNMVSKVAVYNELATGELRPIMLTRTLNAIFNKKKYTSKVDFRVRDLTVTYFGLDIDHGDKVDIEPVYMDKPYGIIRNIHGSKGD